MAEFSAALPALFDQWIELIYRQRRSLFTLLRSTEEVWRHGRFDPRISRQLSEEMHDLEHCQAQLRDAVGEARSMLAFLKSPTLCQTNKYRDVLDMLFDAEGVGRLEADLEAQTAQVNALYVQVQARASQLKERRTQRSRLTVEIALTFLAGTSLADLASLINAGFANPPLFTEVGVILVFAAVVTLLVLRAHGKNSD